MEYLSKRAGILPKILNDYTSQKMLTLTAQKDNTAVDYLRQ